MLLTQTQPAATFATAGYPATGMVAAALNPVCSAVFAISTAILAVELGMASGLRKALISWQDRQGLFVTHATPVRPTATPGSQPRLSGPASRA